MKFCQFILIKIFLFRIKDKDRRMSGDEGRRRKSRLPSENTVEEGGVAASMSRKSSFKRSVTGLVRRVSQRVSRENKEPIRRRGSRRSRGGSTKKSFKRTR